MAVRSTESARIFSRFFSETDLGMIERSDMWLAGSGTMVHLSPFRAGYNLCVSTDFLDRLASQLRANKSAACRRAIQRILAIVKNNFEGGKYKNDVEAEADFRHLVDRDEGCK
jgi:hypothetical protein